MDYSINYLLHFVQKILAEYQDAKHPRKFFGSTFFIKKVVKK
jgi:hypothetical protein